MDPQMLAIRSPEDCDIPKTDCLPFFPLLEEKVFCSEKLDKYQFLTITKRCQYLIISKVNPFVGGRCHSLWELRGEAASTYAKKGLAVLRKLHLSQREKNLTPTNGLTLK